MAQGQIPTLERSTEKLVSVMHSVAQGERLERPKVGVVVSPPPNLKVQVDGITLDRSDCLISAYSMPGYTRHMVGETSYRGGGGGYAEYESHNHPIDNDEKWTDTLVVGDLVGVVPLEGSIPDHEEQDGLYWITGRLIRL